MSHVPSNPAPPLPPPPTPKAGRIWASALLFGLLAGGAAFGIGYTLNDIYPPDYEGSSKVPPRETPRVSRPGRR